ncbi:MAG: hypothetical protein IIZ48_01605 [Erysipelotrichales bacterium]|nr:hypothetical protein [Erysipelotrichales bacterium]
MMKYLKKLFPALGPLGVVFAYLIAGVLGMLPAVLIFYRAEKLGWTGTVLLVVHIGFVICVYAFVKWLGERRYFKALFGEDYYEFFPEEREREEKLRKFRKILTGR